MDCEYNEGNRRPRTLTLEEEIARLQARVKELENPDSTTPAVTLYDPYGSTVDSPSSSPSASVSTHVSGYFVDHGSRAVEGSTVPSLHHS